MNYYHIMLKINYHSDIFLLDTYKYIKYFYILQESIILYLQNLLFYYTI